MTFGTASVTDLSKDLQVKKFAVARTMTGGTDRAFVVPKGTTILGFVLSGTASDAGTTATLSVGTTSGTPVEYVNALDVKTVGTGSGVGLLRGVTAAVGSVLTADTIIYVKYAETGGASTAGSWNLFVLYTTGQALAGPGVS
jgi:hypothetical protein